MPQTTSIVKLSLDLSKLKIVSFIGPNPCAPPIIRIVKSSEASPNLLRACALDTCWLNLCSMGMPKVKIFSGLTPFFTNSSFICEQATIK